MEQHRARPIKRPNPRRLDAGNRIIKILIVFLIGVLACVCVFVSIIICMEPGKEVHKSKEELSKLLKEKSETFAYKQQREKERDWLTYEFGYVEAKARDDMDMGKPGETIFTINRGNSQTPPPIHRDDRQNQRTGENTPLLSSDGRPRGN